MRTNKDIGFIKRQVLKLVTKLQEFFLSKGMLSSYDFLVSIHYYLYFGSLLTLDLQLNSNNVYRAAERHASMVVANSPFILVDESGSKLKKERMNRIKKTIKEAFLMNLTVDLNRLTRLNG